MKPPSWELCEVGKRVEPADYIPCLDNVKAVNALKSMRHMEHRERHCPTEPRPRCLVPLPAGYRLPLPWPRSRDMVRMPALLVFFGKPGSGFPASLFIEQSTSSTSNLTSLILLLCAVMLSSRASVVLCGLLVRR
jgi:hypothetical protein